MEDPQTPHCHQGKKTFPKNKAIDDVCENGDRAKHQREQMEDRRYSFPWVLTFTTFSSNYRVENKAVFFSGPFLLLVVYNTQRHSDGCEIQYIGSSVFILLLLGVSLNVIRSISFQIPFLQVLFQLAATSMLGCPALMVSPSKVEKSLSLWVA